MCDFTSRRLAGRKEGGSQWPATDGRTSVLAAAREQADAVQAPSLPHSPCTYVSPSPSYLNLLLGCIHSGPGPCSSFSPIADRNQLRWISPFSLLLCPAAHSSGDACEHHP